MDDLHKALGDISSIRRQMAHSSEFRGYGPLTLAATGALAIAAATVQSFWIPDPSQRIPSYLALWVSTAVLSAGLAGAQMYTRTRRLHSDLSGEMLRMAVEQFVPALAAGLLMTVVIIRYVAPSVWILPGIWQVIFSLGIFSSCRFLPRAMIVPALWYLLTGLLCIAAAGSRALSPWAMGLPFGAGQLIVAGVLFLRKPEDTDEG